MSVFVVMRRYDLKAGTFFSGLPQGLSSDYTGFFGDLIFRKYDAVAVIRIAAYSHRFVFELRVVEQLDRCVKPVHIAVQYDSVQ